VGHRDAVSVWGEFDGCTGFDAAEGSEGTWFDFWSKTKVVGQWEEVQVPTLDNMAIWVKEGAMICYAKERTWNEVAEVVKVELYGEKDVAGGGVHTDGSVEMVREAQFWL
jgi:alpha-glucosidase (family GH31 glycosyl hydrolase)